MYFDGLVKSIQEYWSSDLNLEGIVICQWCVLHEYYIYCDFCQWSLCRRL